MFENWEHRKVAAAREEVELEEEDKRAARSTEEHVVVAVSMVEKGREREAY